VDALDGDRMLQSYGFAQFPSVHSRTCLVWCLTELGELRRRRSDRPRRDPDRRVG
jgi:hypothetical protein